jgi:transposase
MQTPQFFPLGEGVELIQLEQQEDQLVLHVAATSSTALCPLCTQPATRLHSRYRRVVKDLPCAGQRVQLILHVRKFFCDTAECARKVFAERLPHLVAPWAQMTTRLCQALQTIGLATCGRLGARLAAHLLITTCLYDHCSPDHGEALTTGRTCGVFGPRRFCVSARQNLWHSRGRPGCAPDY